MDAGREDPDPVVVVQVSDEDAADAGLTKLSECAGEEAAWTISDGWVLLGESQDLVDRVAADAADAPLSEDDDFTHWTGVTGDAGIATVYVAPEAGALLAEEADSLFGYGLTEVPPESLEALEDFGGMVATVRFDDGSLELEAAGDAGDRQGALSGGDGAEDLVGSLPDDTAFAVGVGLAEGWFGDLLDEELLEMLEAETGLELPEDAETLAGEAAALAVGGDFDPDGFFDSADGSGVPVGLKVRGDADAIEDVLDRLQAGAEPVFDSDSDGDLVVVGPDADYREQLLEEGGLGNTELFRDAVPDADDAVAIVFVSFDAGEWLDHLAESDEEAAANLRPLSALGLSGWLDGDTSHLVLRVTTD